jgi:fructose/tagatose bisphosphate aldolase
MGQDKEVSISLRINTILEDMGKTANKLSEGLNKGITKIDVGTSLGKSLTKNIQNFKEEYNKFSQLTKGGTSVNIGDSKEAISSGNKLIKLYRDIQAQMKTMGDSGVSALKKMFPDSFDSRIDGLKGKLTSL